jgi:lipoate-protein ligase A
VTRSGASISAASRSWRLLPYHLGPSDYHFALSDALVRCGVTPTVWWHSTQRPTLILGTGQQAEGVDLAACERDSVLIVRRQAGGTAVYAAAGVLGLDIFVPATHPLASPDILEAYRWTGDVWVDALRALGVEAESVSTEVARAAAKEAKSQEAILRLACFGSLSPYEVVVRDRKLVGLAQVRRRGGVLIQSCVHRRFDADRLALLLLADDHVPVASALRQAAIGLEEAASRDLTEREVMDAVHQALGRVLGVELQPGDWSEEELRYAAERAHP